MPTLTQIWRDVVPTATWLSPAGAGAGGPVPDPEIAWIRVLRARVPALEGLEPGDLAIVPEPVLSALDAGLADPSAIVAELARAGVAGLLLVGDGPPAPAAAELGERARARSLAVLRLIGGDPGALERSLVGYLVNRRAELDRQAAQVDAALERLALEGYGLEALAGAVGAALGRAVAIEDERGAAVTVHAPDGVAEAAAAAARYLAQPRQAALRVALPGVGTLALLGPLPASDLDRAVADRVAPLLALEMGGATAARRTRVAGPLESLPADGPPWAVVVARQIVPGEVVSAEERARRRDRLLRLAPARRLLLRGDVTSVDYRMVVVLGRDDPRGLTIASRIAATIGRDVAVSRPFSRPEDRSAAEAEARSTLEAAEAIPTAEAISEAEAGPEVGAFPEPSTAVERPEKPAGTRSAVADGARTGSLRPGPRVLQADRLPAYRLLGELHNLPNGARLAGALLAPLLVGSVKSRHRRVATLRAVLEHPGAAGAAEALGIHRNTLLYRIARIEALTGWRLDDPDLRLALAVAVRLVQNAQSGESVPG